MSYQPEYGQDNRVKGIQPFVDAIKEFFGDLLSGKYEKIYDDFTRRPWPEEVLRRVLVENAPYGTLELPDIAKFPYVNPEDIYQWTIPPDEYLIEVIREGTTMGLPDDFIAAYGDEDGVITLKSLFDQVVVIPDSEWNININLWVVGGMSQCSAELVMLISNGKLSVFLQEIGVL